MLSALCDSIVHVHRLRLESWQFFPSEEDPAWTYWLPSAQPSLGCWGRPPARGPGCGGALALELTS